MTDEQFIRWAIEQMAELQLEPALGHFSMPEPLDVEAEPTEESAEFEMAWIEAFGTKQRVCHFYFDPVIRCWRLYKLEK